MAYAVERRDDPGRHWYVVDVAAGWELAPVFDSVITAVEIARKATARAPFFDNIPEVAYGSPADRSGLPAEPRSKHR